MMENITQLRNQKLGRRRPNKQDHDRTWRRCLPQYGLCNTSHMAHQLFKLYPLQAHISIAWSVCGGRSWRG